MVISSFHPVDYKGASSWSPLLVRPGGGSDRRLALFTLAASRVIWLIVWLMGGLCGSPHTALHNEDSFIFNTIECLSHSTLCGEDWLSLCACSPEASAPSSPFRRAYVPAPACCSWTRKRQASLFSLFFSQWIDYRVWNGTEIAPTPGRRMHRLAFWSSNISHQDTLRGGRTHVPQVVHCEHNNLLSTKEK